MYVRCEAILTQLVFEHSLRIRMKAEVHGGSSAPSQPVESVSVTPAAVTSPNDEHSTERSNDAEGSLNSLAPSEAQSRETTLEGDESADESKPEKEAATKAPEAKNLVGKINNLVTTDLGNIVDSRDFIRLLVYTPVSVTFCVIFLYAILGWSALVGLGVIIISIPLPSFLAKLVQDVQASTLKKTDGRMQAVTESERRLLVRLGPG